MNQELMAIIESEIEKSDRKIAEIERRLKDWETEKVIAEQGFRNAYWNLKKAETRLEQLTNR